MLQRARPCHPPTASHYHRIGFVCTVMGKGGQISSISLTGVLGVLTIRRPRWYGDENTTYHHLLNICTSVCHCDSQPYISMRRHVTAWTPDRVIGLLFTCRATGFLLTFYDLISSFLLMVVARYFSTLPAPSPSFLSLLSPSGTFLSRLLTVLLTSGSFCMLPTCSC